MELNCAEAERNIVSIPQFEHFFDPMEQSFHSIIWKVDGME
jgi:hypothetical protein